MSEVSNGRKEPAYPVVIRALLIKVYMLSSMFTSGPAYIIHVYRLLRAVAELPASTFQNTHVIENVPTNRPISGRAE